MPTIQYIQEQPFLIPDEVTELPTGTQPALPTIPTKDWYPTGYDKQAQAALPAQPEPDFWSRVGKVGNKLLGTGGEERYQLWPERMVRSGLTLPAEVMQGKVLSGAGLRREDFTDIPPSQESQTWIGKKLGLPAVPEQPLDPLIERAQDVAGLAGGTMFAGVKPGVASLGAGPVRPHIEIKPFAETPMFYSNVENAVKASKQNAASKDQWLSYLKNQPGVKPEELEWTVANLPEGKITKQQLEQHIAENKVQFNEVWKGGNYNEENIRKLENERINILNQLDEARKNNKNLTGEERTNNINKMKELNDRYELLGHEIYSPKNTPVPTKYQSYQLPGGEPGSYRELLLTLPEKDLGVEAAGKQIYESFDRVGGGQTWEQLAPETRQMYIDRAKEQGIKATPENLFQSSHWDEPNVLAHVRMNDRNIPDVGKSLHIEEIQSDWHQAGRKQGYIEKDIMDRSVIKNKMKEIENKAPSNLSGIEHSQWLENQPEYIRLRNEYNSSIPNNENKVPNAPFKKTWDELALKRTINEAVRNGYDAISWTPGEAQAARYDLSKQVDRVDYTPKTGELLAHKGSNIVLKEKNVSADKLADYIGKEAAEKILNNPTSKFKNDTMHVLTGNDLKVGGQGMKAFYDKMMVDKVNALAKKYGGKVETKEIPISTKEKLKDVEGMSSFEAADYMKKNKNKGQPVHVLKLTPELKKAVSEKGFPLFTGGIPHVPPPEEPTFDERWRDRVPDEMTKRDQIKDLLEQQKIRNLPLDYTPPERKFEGRPVHLTRIDYKPEF